MKLKELRCSKCGGKLEHSFGKYLRCSECYFISEYELTTIGRIKRKLKLLEI